MSPFHCSLKAREKYTYVTVVIQLHGDSSIDLSPAVISLSLFMFFLPFSARAHANTPIQEAAAVTQSRIVGITQNTSQREVQLTYFSTAHPAQSFTFSYGFVTQQSHQRNIFHQGEAL